MGKLKAALMAIAGSLFTYITSAVAIKCPALLSQLPTIIGAGITALVGFLMLRPKSAPDLAMKGLILGAVAAFWQGIQYQFGQLCPEIITNFWGFATSILVGGIGLFLKSPKEESGA